MVFLGCEFSSILTSVFYLNLVGVLMWEFEEVGNKLLSCCALNKQFCYLLVSMITVRRIVQRYGKRLKMHLLTRILAAFYLRTMN